MMFRLFRFFRKKKSIDAVVEGEFLWCIVGNIVDRHYYGEAKEVKRGTKHFRPGTKVYCIPEFNGLDSIRVIGRSRYSHKLVNVILRTKYVKNFRLQKVYSPTVFDLIAECPVYRVNNNYRLSVEELEQWMEGLKKHTEEIPG